MKKFLAVSFAALSLSAVSSAATISCVINQTITQPAGAQANGATTSGVVACGALSNAAIVAEGGAGATVTAIQLIVKGSFNDSAIAPAYNGQLNFAFTEQSSDFIIAAISGNAPTGGPSDTGSTGNLSGSKGGLNLSSIAGFNVNVLETLVSGGRFPSDANVTVSYIATVTGSNVIPEPSTFIMLGTALTGLGVFARRRKA